MFYLWYISLNIYIKLLIRTRTHRHGYQNISLHIWIIGSKYGLLVHIEKHRWSILKKNSEPLTPTNLSLINDRKTVIFTSSKKDIWTTECYWLPFSTVTLFHHNYGVEWVRGGYAMVILCLYSEKLHWLEYVLVVHVG